MTPARRAPYNIHEHFLWQQGLGPKPQGYAAMTPTRLRECLAACDWTQRGLARLLRRDEGTVRQWARGTVSIPYDVAGWLERVARYHEQNPPPAR